jgi:murein DD-endopeptidase MepM/ murein hydrolase activator NlpD
MVLQSKSLDTIMQTAQEKEKMLASIPSIKPVRADKLAKNVGLLSGFGYRIHPIYKVPRMHTGIDFTAPKGTPIQATGDGVVVKAESNSGYGRCVIIDHGYGYQTLYAHMSRIDIKQGQRVKRGQRLGLVGSTGASTAPHCHYEVHLRGERVNPVHYVMDGLSTKEYASLVNIAQAANQSMD